MYIKYISYKIIFYFRKGSVIAELNIHYGKDLNETETSIISFELNVALSKIDYTLTLAGTSVRMLEALSFVYRKNDLEQECECTCNKLYLNLTLILQLRNVSFVLLYLLTLKTILFTCASSLHVFHI